MTEVFTFIANMFLQLFNLLNDFPIATFGDYDISYLQFMIALIVIPIMIGFLKPSLFQNSKLGSNTNEEIANQNYNKHKKKGGR